MKWRLALVATIAVFANITSAKSYTYTPNQADRQELQACLEGIKSGTSLLDCITCTATRISASMLREVNSPQPPTHPSQTYTMILIAATRCGIDLSLHAPIKPSQKPCLDGQSKEISQAVAEGLRAESLEILTPGKTDFDFLPTEQKLERLRKSNNDAEWRLISYMAKMQCGVNIENLPENQRPVAFMPGDEGRIAQMYCRERRPR